jgi:regulator of sirC expression with transglutaminase-like and TPR domain
VTCDPCDGQREEINDYQMQLHQLSSDHKHNRANLTRKEEEHKKEIERLDQKLRDELTRAESLEAAMKQVCH